MSDPHVRERIAAAWRELANQAAAFGSGIARPLAVGWATVESERAEAELAAALGLPEPGAAFRAAPRSAALGGACRIAAGVPVGGGSLVVLEPDTEGRLAGSLARLGEGPVAAWLAVGDLASAIRSLRSAGSTVSSEREGPFGGERLILGRPSEAPGRHRLLVVRAPGTIRP